MKSLFRFLSQSKGAILIVVLLLAVQAYCDLSLPSYTSDILNVGLQQGGIENAVMDTVRIDSLDTLTFFMTDDDAVVVTNSYNEPDSEGICTLLEDADTEQLNSLLLLPESIAYQLSGGLTIDDTTYTLEQIQNALNSGLMTKEQLLAQLDTVMSSMEDLTDTYLNQIAVYYVSAEYTAQGLDMNKIQQNYLLDTGGKMLLMAILMSVVSICVGLVASIASAKTGRSMRKGVYEKVLSFTNAEMEHFSTASLKTRSTNDIQQIQMVMVIFLRVVLYAPILAIGGIIKVVETSTGLSWIIVLAVVVLLAGVGILMGITMPKFKIMQKLVDRLNLVSREMLTGIMPIRAFSREKHEEDRFDKASRDLYKTQLFTNRVMSIMTPAMTFVMNGVSVLIVWFGAKGIDAGTMQIGDMTAFITYSMVIVMGFLMLAMVAVMLPRAGAAADRVAEVLDTEVTLKDSDNVKDNELANAYGTLKFNDVEFCYPGSDEPALEHISFTASPGKTTAIIGSTGCGKSTLINLVPRFYDVTKGSITIDDVNIKDISQEKLRSMLGYVPQKGVLFSGTIESNIKYGGDFITDEDMASAADIAQAEEFISSKPGKYKSRISQGGSNVSGGQKQRLSIARAVAKNPKIFLFDDSFSALDYKTDLTLRKALAKKTSNATVVIVAQRISTVLHADNIIVLDDGKIAGMGTHSELLASCPAYMEIARSQLSEAELQANMKGDATNG